MGPTATASLRRRGTAAGVVVASLLLHAPAPGVARDATLARGDRGTAVRALNERLAALGYLPADGRGSRFTQATHHAVVALQKWEGLQRDGVVGPMTRRALETARRPRPVRGGIRGARIEVLLDRQLTLLVRDGVVTRTIAVSTGASGYATFTGSYRVYRRELCSWSYPYRVWLPYAAYFFRGIAFHGYASVPPQPASHGCVRVPVPFMREMFRFARLRTPVDVLAYSGASR